MDKYNFDISPNDSYPHLTDETIEINELLDCFSPGYYSKKTKSFRFENPKNVIVGHLNINSVRNKFELLKPFIYNTFDVFLYQKLKPTGPFQIINSVRLGIGCLDTMKIALEEA